MLDSIVAEFLSQAPHKAFATTGPKGLNVVPVSTLRISEGDIILVDYFMEKTAENVKENHEVSLVAWEGTEGFQVKGTAKYLTEGSIFNEVTQWAANMFPDRTVRGVISMQPQVVFTVKAGQLPVS